MSAPGNPIELRNVSIEVDAPSIYNWELYEISSFSLEASCGEPARATINANKAIADVTSLRGEEEMSDLMDLSADFQKAVFESVKLGSDCTIKVNDNTRGDGNLIEFKGTVSSPSLSVSAGNLSASFSVLHEDTQMEAFNPSIYQTDQHSMGGGHDGTDVLSRFSSLFDGAPGAAKSHQVSDHIQMLLDATVHDGGTTEIILYPAGKDPANAEHRTTLVRNAHEINRVFVTKVEEFLKRSKTGTGLHVPDIGDRIKEFTLLDGGEAGGAKVDLPTYRKWMLASYLGSKNFFNFLVSTVCPAFLFEYVCNLDSQSYMQHVHYNHLPKDEIGIKPASISLNLGSTYQRPLGQVVVFGPSADVMGDGTSDALMDIGAWPNPIDPPGGKIINLQAPGWYAPQGNMPEQIFIEPVKRPAGAQGGRQIQPNALQKARTVAKLQGANQKDVISFLQIWARKNYGLFALQNTSASFTLPLDVSWGQVKGKPIGERYTITIEPVGKGYPVAVFEGHLQRVKHDVILQGAANQGSATTTLEFQYIKMPGFELPGDE